MPGETMADFVASLERPRAVDHHGEGRRAHRRGDRRVGAAARGGRHHRRLRQRPLRRHPPPRGGAARRRGCTSVGTGVSGGEEGALHGPSIMPGGSAESYAKLGPMFEKIAAQVDGVPCCTHVGPDGAGHFVKMVHNGIEYADMQLIAEAYDLLRAGLGATPAEIAEIFRRVEQRRAGVVPHRDHRRRARAHRRGDRPAVRGHRAGPGRAEGHRPVDRAERPGPGHPDHRDRRGDLRPLAVRARRPARGGPPGVPRRG